jgi:hypothetical protein
MVMRKTPRGKTGKDGKRTWRGVLTVLRAAWLLAQLLRLVRWILDCI